jgi:LmbE family N-acetylglucosaminyl deacetylase
MSLVCLKPFKQRKFPHFGSTRARDAEITDKTEEKRNVGKRVLFVTAHPDDECMFFGPAIVEFIDAGIQVYLLCFSTGFMPNNGKSRKRELLRSCSVLKIPVENVTLLR